MKKLIYVLPVLVLLTGCAVQETFETVADIYEITAVQSSYKLALDFPEEASAYTMKTEDGALYECEGYSLCTQSIPGDSIDKTLEKLTGYRKDALSVIQTQSGEFQRYDFAWAVAGEGVQQICRGVILDDGTVHHAVTVMADYDRAGELLETWQKLLGSAHLISTG